MLDARLKILACCGYGDIRDAMWTHAMFASRDANKLERMRKMRKAYLARYLHQPLSTWDDMSRTEIEEWVEAASTIMGAESGNETIPLG